MLPTLLVMNQGEAYGSSSSTFGLPPGAFHKAATVVFDGVVFPETAVVPGKVMIEVQMEVSAIDLFCGKVKMNWPKVPGVQSPARTASVVQM